MKLGIKAKEIMNRNFPLLDSTLTLEDCIKKLKDRFEGCVILDNGQIHEIISYDDLLKFFFTRKKKDLKLKEIETARNFAVVLPDTDMFDIIELMRKTRIDFVLVHGEKEFGLITKKEIAEINQLLFDRLKRQEITA